MIIDLATLSISDFGLYEDKTLKVSAIDPLIALSLKTASTEESISLRVF